MCAHGLDDLFADAFSLALILIFPVENEALETFLPLSNCDDVDDGDGITSRAREIFSISPRRNICIISASA